MTEPQKKIKGDDGKTYVLAKPPNEVFLHRKGDEGGHVLQSDAENISVSQNEVIPMLDLSKGINGVTYPDTGGQYVWHVGRKYPRKGHVYAEALRDCFFPKRIFISWLGFLARKPMIPFFAVFALLPRRWKGRILENFIDSYISVTDEILRDHFLHPQFNTDFCRGLSQPIMDFLMYFGVDRMKAAKMSLIIITLFEYDMAYRLRAEDLLSETTKEKLLADPVGEAKRLIKILAERDWSRPHLVEKFDRFTRILKYGFFFIRKPFRKALASVNFTLLQLDDIDRYQVRHWTGYNWFGMTIEERVKKWPVESYPAFRLVRESKPIPAQ